MAVEASSVRVSTMADGTLRIVCDIEPRHAQAAFALFGAPGTALAIAALVPEHARQAEPEPEPIKGGQIAKWLGIRCGEFGFQDWLPVAFPREWAATMGLPMDKAAAETVRAACGVKSRAEFDNDPAAAQRFHVRIREPWAAYQQRGEA